VSEALLKIEFDRTSTVDQVADRLRRMIWQGELAPGYRLKEVPLSKSFGVSRNTIRDAIRTLAQDGLLSHELHRGAVVRTLGADDVSDLYGVRRLLETSAVGNARPSDEELAAIRTAVEGIEDSVSGKDWEAAVTADRDFHIAIVAMHRSPRLHRFYEQISAESRFALGVLWLHDAAGATPKEIAAALGQVAGEHRLIYEAIAAGKRGDARKALEKHLVENETRVVEILQERSAGEDGES
jgi:DNA-binding GntR family transcriptional regulator